MADRTPGQLQHQRPTTTLGGGGGGGGQIMGIKTLIISGGILLILTGLTLTATVLGLIFLSPLIILTSPIWIPIGTILMIILFGFLWVCGFGVATILGCTWIYNYIRGRHPFGSERVDYARSRIAGTANQMRDYAREYSGYLQSKVIKDVAPGA